MVQYLKTIGEEIGPDLQSLAGSIRDIITPNRKYEEALRIALAKDPSLFGKLASVNKTNPGALSKIFGPHAGAFLGGLNEDPSDALSRAKADAGVSAMGDSNVSRDAGLLGAVGQTSSQRRSSEAGADVDEITAEHKKIIQDSLNHVKESNPELYSQLSGIGALREYFGTDANTETVKANAAQEASAEMEARGRVDAILRRDPKKLYDSFKKGEVSVGDLGSAFSDPRSQMLKIFFDQQMRNEHDDFMLRRQAQAQADQDARQAKSLDAAAARQEKSLTAAELRQQERLDAERQKNEEKDKKIQERQIAYNDVSINKFIAATQSKSGGRMSPEQIKASLPQMNELLQRNQLMKGLDIGTAPQFVLQQEGGFLGFGQHSVPVLMNADGTPNTEYNKETKTTTSQSRAQGNSTQAGSAKPNEPSATRKVTDTIGLTTPEPANSLFDKTYKMASGNNQKAFDTARKSGTSLEDIKKSQWWGKQTPESQAELENLFKLSK